MISESPYSGFQFRVVRQLDRVHIRPNRGILVEDDWDDWFTYSTLYALVIFDGEGVRHDLGGVKIGQFGMSQRRPELPNSFSLLDKRFFSLGQDDSYYEILGNLDPILKNVISTALNDVVADHALWEKALLEPVTGTSLLRSVKRQSVEGQFRRLFHGGARLSSYSFKFTQPKRAIIDHPAELSFHVEPESQPPTNIHVIIGRNGVGKTYTLHQMTKALVAPLASARQSGRFIATDTSSELLPFANLVAVSFSAFDEFVVKREEKDRSVGLQYSYIGLKRITPNGPAGDTPKSPPMLAKEFVDSIRVCFKGARLARWKRAVQMLEADPIFKEAEISSLVEANSKELEETATNLFRKLSSGHKIVILSITRLVETVDERTLVLLDEPEAHLHPPLFSAFIRSLSDLLINRNGVAIVATHSPVVLQEVPRECVWKLRRVGFEVAAERPTIETFGENVGVLTREVFGLEVVQSGFHKMLMAEVNKSPNYDSALLAFQNQQGAEARAILRGLFNVKR